MAKKKRKAVVWIVIKVLEKYHKNGNIHECTFEKILPEIKKYFPKSKFNPFHLAWYKHHFLKGDLEMLYTANNQMVER